ncbi:unnamed protein product [Haemonchus placei]|uniref:Uncharacterized protein n=1 Tax=Haemonchus placei TaxID=6290 RepID=A0A0N4VVB1_HAEPC|nr:unnamed protein product [Haemonchus placei]
MKTLPVDFSLKVVIGLPASVKLGLFDDFFVEMVLAIDVEAVVVAIGVLTVVGGVFVKEVDKGTFAVVVVLVVVLVVEVVVFVVDVVEVVVLLVVGVIVDGAVVVEE